MVNQIYKENKTEELYEKMKIVSGGGTSESGGVYFSKYFGIGALDKMVGLLNLKAKHQKVLIIESESSYINFSFDGKGIEFEPVRIAVDGFTKDMVQNLAQSVDETIRFCVAIGGDFEVGVAKCLSSENGLKLVAYINKFCTLDAFLGKSLLKDSGVYTNFLTQQIDFIYIESESVAGAVQRDLIADAVFNMVAQLCAVVELYINCCLCKDNGYSEFEGRIVGIFNKLNAILNSAIDLSKEETLGIIDLGLELADVISRSNVVLVDKESVFATIYDYLCLGGNLSVPQLRAVATQVYIKLYKDFLVNLNAVVNSYFDIEKRVKLFDKTFRNANLQFNFDSPITEKEMYLLRRFQQKIIKKIDVIDKLVDGLMYKTLDLFCDSGFAFLNGVNKDVVMQSVYFSADVISENCLLKVMRNLGVLDFYN